MSAQQSILLIAGSPSEQSRSSALLDSVSHRLALRSGFVVDRLNIRELPAQALLLAEWGHIVTSVIPTRSVDQLELVIGSDVVALVKSTEVSIAKL